MYLRLFSIITLVITLSMALAFTSMIRQTLSLGVFKVSLGSKFFSGSFSTCCLILALFVYRRLCELPKFVFYLYILANASILIVFFVVRLRVIYFMHNNFSWMFYIIFLLLLIISTGLGLSRFFFNLGFKIDQNPNFVFTLLERISQPSVTFFSHLGRKVSGHLPRSPGSSGVDRHFALGVGTFVAASVTAGCGVYLCYEAYQSRMINLRNLNITEVNNDRQAVKDGFMTKENYHKKWDDFGNARK